jgi:uncharacterized UBP type Zn finger protein
MRQELRKESWPNLRDPMSNERERGGEPRLARGEGRRGLANLGNTCFMNSVFQCLSHTPEFKQFLLNAYSSEPSNAQKTDGDSLGKAFSRLLLDLWEEGDEKEGEEEGRTKGDEKNEEEQEYKEKGHENVEGIETSSVAAEKEKQQQKHKTWLDPSAVRRLIGKTAPRFLGQAQQDAQELMAFFLDALHEELVSHPFVNPIGSLSSSSSQLQRKSETVGPVESTYLKGVSQETRKKAEEEWNRKRETTTKA